MDPRPPPVETASEQQRRLLVYVHSLQLARRRVHEQRSEQRAQGVGPAVSRADVARQRGNESIREGNHELAAEAYSEAVAELTGLEMVSDAAWSLVLALSNRATALLGLRRYEEVLEDCTNAWVLLERHEGTFDATSAAGIGEKLARREAACHRGVETQQRDAARAEAAQREAAERARVRSERRRRARQARAARLARERAEAEADAHAGPGRAGGGNGSCTAGGGRVPRVPGGRRRRPTRRRVRSRAPSAPRVRSRVARAMPRRAAARTSEPPRPALPIVQTPHLSDDTLDLSYY